MFNCEMVLCELAIIFPGFVGLGIFHYAYKAYEKILIKLI